MSWEAWGTPEYLDYPVCETCEGEGRITNDFGQVVSCIDCAGTGHEEIPERMEDDVM